MRLLIAICALLPVAIVCAAEVLNADFTAGGDEPAGWKLSGGAGRWVDRNYLEVTGDGKGANNWSCECRFESGKVYRFEMRARAVKGTGCVVSGPTFANHDWQLTPEWKDYSFVFVAPRDADKALVRVGQWEANGTFQFDRVRIVPLLPVVFDTAVTTKRKYTPVIIRVPGLPDTLLEPGPFGGATPMGEGESTYQGRYSFAGTFGGRGGNYHHVLAHTTAGFNSNRWCFSGEQEVVYRFQRRRERWADVRLAVEVSYRTRGGCGLDFSADGREWTRLATLDKIGTTEMSVRAELLRGNEFQVRIRGLAKDTSLQVTRCDVFASLQAVEPGPTPRVTPDAIGRTLFATIDRESEKLKLREFYLLKSDASQFAILATKETDGEAVATLGGRLLPAGGSAISVPDVRVSLRGELPSRFDLTLPTLPPGKSTLELTLSAPGLQPTVASIPLDVPELHRSDYGQQIDAATSDRAAVWYCDATRKIGRQRPAPTASAPAAVLSAARNDREAVQIVVRPNEPLKGLVAIASDLTCSATSPHSQPLSRTAGDGSTIPASQVKVLRVAYHFVHHPTDVTGVVDWWPDALPPILRPLDVPAGVNQPLWVLVHVPKDAVAGDYTGTLSLEAEGWSAKVPLKLHVWNFALPDRNHIETAFGLSPETAFKYHNVKTDEDKRRVLDLYLQSFAEHRISPYDPAPLDPIRVKLLPEADPPRAELDFTRFDAAMQQAVERYHFSNFMLHLQGMGGGTFHERFEPKIGN